MLKKIVEHRNLFKIVKMLKKLVGVISITKLILDFGINLTISKLLALVLVVEKQLIKAITKNKAI